jgi:hypothetical protein
MMQRLQSICEVYDFIDMEEQLFRFNQGVVERSV